MSHVRARRTQAGERRYEVRYRGPDRRERSKTFRRKVDADRFAKEVDIEIARGAWVDPRKASMPFADWREQWWATTVNLRPSTRARDESYLRNHVASAFDDLRLGDIDQLTVRTWVAELEASGLAPATVKKAYEILSKIMRAAVEARLLVATPCVGVQLPKIDRVEMRFLTANEVHTLGQVIEPEWRAFVLLGAYGGLRLGEQLGLRRRRVDLLRRRVEVAETLSNVKGATVLGPPKTRAGHRSVPIPAVVASALEAHMDGDRDAFVFTNRDGGPVDPNLFRRRAWTRAIRDAGLEDPQPRIHDLRHTAVALWIAAGATPKEIAARAGHSSVVTVLDRYGHLMPGLEDATTDALDRIAQAAQIETKSPPTATVSQLRAE